MAARAHVVDARAPPVAVAAAAANAAEAAFGPQCRSPFESPHLR